MLNTTTHLVFKGYPWSVYSDDIGWLSGAAVSSGVAIDWLKSCPRLSRWILLNSAKIFLKKWLTCFFCEHKTYILSDSIRIYSYGVSQKQNPQSFRAGNLKKSWFPSSESPESPGADSQVKHVKLRGCILVISVVLFRSSFFHQSYRSWK